VARLVEAPKCRGFDSRLLNPSVRTMALGLAQPLREMSITSIYGWEGDKVAGV